MCEEKRISWIVDMYNVGHLVESNAYYKDLWIWSPKNDKYGW
jgi:hypothetical protein